MSDSRLIKIFRPGEWEQFERDGVFRGSPDDLRDGFIHLSTAEQAEATRARHFADVDGAISAWVTVDATLEPHLRWENSKSGEAFPHLYAPLPRTCVERYSPPCPDKVAAFLEANQHEPWARLRVGDRVRFVQMPSGVDAPGYTFHESTRALYRRLIDEGDVHEVEMLDDWGIPWIHVSDPGAEDEASDSLAINDDSWVRAD